MRKLTLEELKKKKYGALTVIKFIKIDKSGEGGVWQWQCDCGNIIEHTPKLIRSGKKKSCGCLSRKLGVVGEKHNLLTAISCSHKDKGGANIWLWQCDCGNTVKSKLSSVRNGNRKSCGCQKKKKCIEYLKKTRRKGINESCKNQLYGVYKRNAGYRGIDFKLSREIFMNLIVEPCEYCGAEPSNKQQVEWNDDILYYSGIDRVNNKLGYLVDNVVPCCIICNKGKREMEKEDFLNWIDLVYNFNKDKNKEGNR